MDSLAVVRIFLLTTLSFVLAMLWTPALTHLLYKYRLGKGIRDAAEAPIFASLHRKKASTPTMGGVLVWGTTLVLAGVFYYLSLLTDGIFSQLNFLSRSETL